LQKDFLFTGRYIGKILEFAKYYNKNEILDSIPITYYVELNQKKTKLEKIGMYAKERRRLLKMGKTKNLPVIRKYKKQLQKLVSI